MLMPSIGCKCWTEGTSQVSCTIGEVVLAEMMLQTLFNLSLFLTPVLSHTCRKLIAKQRIYLFTASQLLAML